MLKFMLSGIIATLLGITAWSTQDPPKMPAAEKEHGWLAQLAGEWETEGEITMEPGKDPTKSKGTESVRKLGEFWIIADGKAEMMGMNMGSVFTLGFDPKKKKYVGSWVDSMTSIMWKYEGEVDATGKILTLDTEGPCPMAPDKISKFKEVIEIKDKDTRTFSSSMQGDDGKWTTFVKVNYKRKS